ncbi:PiggyBac transposable element-derived protein, partial [Trinorchestia longiramus]
MDPSSFYGSRCHRSDADDSSSNYSSSSSDWNPNSSEENSSASSASDLPVHVANESEDSETGMDNSEVPADNSWTPTIASQRSIRFTGKTQLLKKPTPSGENNSVVPLDLYSLFVTNEIIDSIMNKTNRYATQILQSKLSRPLLLQGLTIYADNFYLSVPLVEKLLQEKTYSCGTVQINKKKLPHSVSKAKLKKGEIAGLMNSKGLKVCNWKDKRNVLTLSTVPEHSGNLLPSGKKNRNGTEIIKPQFVLDYNTTKMRVDESDQITSYNTALRRSTKSYRKLAIELLTGTAVTNAWALYNQFYNQQKTMDMTEFKECLVTSLITGKMNEEMLLKPKRCDIGGLRFRRALVEAEGPKRKTKKRSRSCYDIIANNEGSSVAKRKARRVNTFCDSCDGKPFLCVSCFSLKQSPRVQ